MILKIASPQKRMTVQIWLKCPVVGFYGSYPKMSWIFAGTSMQRDYLGRIARNFCFCKILNDRKCVFFLVMKL